MAAAEERIADLERQVAEPAARTYVTEVWCPPPDNGRQALHSRMPDPEPLPEPEPEAEL